MRDTRWAVSPIDRRCHAFTPATVERVAVQGYAVARCQHASAARSVPVDEPSGTICTQCAALVASELPDPGRGGPP